MIDGPDDAADRDLPGLPGFPVGLDPTRAAALLRWASEVPEPGETVGRYRVLRTLGRGGTGVVHLAHDPVLDRNVALKFLPVRLGSTPFPEFGDRRPDDESARHREAELVAEARAASALDHPHIGTVYEIGTDRKGRRFMAMASYEGGTLRDRLTVGPLEIREALRIARQVVDGLGAAHRAGIVHRDVKPENLVFDGDGRVQIVDFGIAGSTRPDEPDRTSGGTTAYMSPEQHSGAQPDPRADLWALAVVLHEMVTGRRPGQEPGIAAEPDPSLPEPLRTALARALHPEPARRFPDAATFDGALASAERALDSMDRRGRRIMLAAGAGVVCLALLTGGLLVGRELPRVTEARGSAAGSFDPATRVLVADFAAADELQELALAAREAFLVDLQQSSFVNPLTRPQMGAILQRMGRSPDELVLGPLATEMAQRAGAGAVLEGTVARAGAGMVVSGRALQPETGRELFAVRVTAGSDRLIGAIEELSREMRARLGESRQALARSAPLPEVTTSSIEALRLYAQAERALMVDNERVRTLLGAALDRDSTFAMAHRLASADATNRLSFADAARHMEQAWIHRGRLPERERLHVESIYAANVELDPAAAVRTLEVLLERFPDDSRAAGNMASLKHSWLLDDEGAAADFRHSLELEPESPFALSYGIYLHYLVGDAARVDSLVVRARDAGLAPFVERWEMVRAFADGNPEAATRACDRLVEAVSSPIPQADDLEMCGSIDVALGRVEIGIERLEGALEAALARGRHRNGAHAAQGLALAELMRGDRPAAAARLLDFIERAPGDRIEEPDRSITRANFRIQALLMGDAQTADRIAALMPPPDDPEHWLSRGMAGLVDTAERIGRGDGSGALARIDRAFPPAVRPVGLRMWHALLRGMALELGGDRAGAEREYASAANPGFLPLPYLTKDRLHYSVALAALLRVQEEAGARDRAAVTRARLAALGTDGWVDRLDAVYPIVRVAPTAGPADAEFSAPGPTPRAGDRPPRTSHRPGAGSHGSPK